jgi:SRF-type transcription factor (DNA-binding and dimerisation domain)
VRARDILPQRVRYTRTYRASKKKYSISLEKFVAMSDNEPQPSPSGHDDAAVAVGGLAGNGNNGTVPPGSAGSEANRGVKRPRPSAADDDDDDEDGKPGRERRKIEIKFIQDKSRRHITFSKRKAGIMKKVRKTISIAAICWHVRSCTLHAPIDRHPTRSDAILILGIRIVCPYWNPGAAARGLRDWSCLYVHNTEAPTSGDKGRGKEPHTGMHCSHNPRSIVI